MAPAVSHQLFLDKQMIYDTSTFQSNQQHKQVPLVTALFLPFLKHLDTLETTASGEPGHSTPLFLTSDEGKRGKRQTHHITIHTQTLLARPSQNIYIENRGCLMTLPFG